MHIARVKDDPAFFVFIDQIEKLLLASPFEALCEEPSIGYNLNPTIDQGDITVRMLLKFGFQPLDLLLAKSIASLMIVLIPNIDEDDVDLDSINSPYNIVLKYAMITIHASHTIFRLIEEV